MITQCRECGRYESLYDGYKWMRDRKNDFCCEECHLFYEQRREYELEYQMALSFQSSENEIHPHSQTFTPRRKAQDPVPLEAFTTLYGPYREDSAQHCDDKGDVTTQQQDLKAFFAGITKDLPKKPIYVLR